MLPYRAPQAKCAPVASIGEAAESAIIIIDGPSGSRLPLDGDILEPWSGGDFETNGNEREACSPLGFPRRSLLTSC